MEILVNLIKGNGYFKVHCDIKRLIYIAKSYLLWFVFIFTNIMGLRTKQKRELTGLHRRNRKTRTLHNKFLVKSLRKNLITQRFHFTKREYGATIIFSYSLNYGDWKQNLKGNTKGLHYRGIVCKKEESYHNGFINKIPNSL